MFPVFSTRKKSSHVHRFLASLLLHRLQTSHLLVGRVPVLPGSGGSSGGNGGPPPAPAFSDGGGGNGASPDAPAFSGGGSVGSGGGSGTGSVSGVLGVPILDGGGGGGGGAGTAGVEGEGDGGIDGGNGDKAGPDGSGLFDAGARFPSRHSDEGNGGDRSPSGLQTLPGEEDKPRRKHKPIPS